MMGRASGHMVLPKAPREREAYAVPLWACVQPVHGHGCRALQAPCSGSF